MLDQIENSQFLLYKRFFEIYPTKMDDKGREGCFVIGPSNGCYPLTLYPYSLTKFGDVANKTRVSAFKVAARKVKKNIYNIFELLNKYDEWTHELETELEKWFEYPETAANDANFNNGMKKRKAS